MNLSTWAIRKPIPSIVIFILLTIAGIMSFHALAVQDMPDLEWPAISVIAVLPGATPIQTETDVTRKIENAVASVTGVRHIHTTIEEGVSSVLIEFDLKTNISAAMSHVRDALSHIRNDLPKAMTEPTVTKIDTASSPIVTYALSSKTLSEEELSWFIDTTVSQALLGIPGVGKMSRLGGVKREVIIELDPTRLNAMQLTIVEVIEQLNRIHLDTSGGKGEIGGGEQNLRIQATARTLSDIKAINIVLKNNHTLRLDQIATIRDSVSDRSQLALFDGKPVVGFQIQRARGYSDLTIGNAANKAVHLLQAQYPSVKIEKVSDTVTATREQYHFSLYMLLEGAVLAIIVVWFFLKDWRATWISAVALPLSVIPTFALMHMLGFTINSVTLLALALVIGLLVDDAIVEIENVVRHLRSGKLPIQAATEATNEIGLAVVATTMTLVAVFLPTSFMDGIAGKFFKQFGWTAAGAVLSSLLVARLLTPMMAAYLLKVHPSEPYQQHSSMMQVYITFVTRCLQHRHLTLLAAVAFFIASLLLIPLLPTAFMPTIDYSYTQIQVELEPGSTLSDTQRTVSSIQRRLQNVPEIAHIFAAIGIDPYQGGNQSAGNLRTATLIIVLTPRTERARSQQTVENVIRASLKNIPGARFNVGGLNPGEKLELLLTGNDAQQLEKSVRIVEKELRTLTELNNVSSSISILQPEIVVTPDLTRAAQLGVTPYAISETLRLATVGDFEPALSKLKTSEKQIDIRVRLPHELRKNIATLNQLKISGQNGLVPLSSVTQIKLDSGPAQITRRDRSRIVTIKAELGGVLLGEVLEKVEKLPSLHNLPAGVRKLESGDTEQMVELFSNFGLAMLAGVVCIYLVLVLLFEDFFQPLTVLVALPLSVGGAFAALILTGKSLSLPSLLGLIMLMGITTKNSILLVEYAITAIKKDGVSQFEALIEACKKRAQPIIMTTVAMGAGMLPIAVGLGTDASFRSPMAIAVIGGLITSTLLSLIVIPVVFTYIYQLQKAIARFFRDI